jgi:transcriptional regulator with XRE-family HTH domain
MAKRKVRPHPGVLKQLLKEKNLTQVEVAADGGIDRKTQAKINRGEEVKLETLQKVANKLKVPITYFDPPAGRSADQPPAGSSVNQGESQLEDSGRLSLLLRKVDVDDFWRMLAFIDSTQIQWILNLPTIDDEAMSLLEQFGDAVNDFDKYESRWWRVGLRQQLDYREDQQKKTRHMASLLEKLAKHGLAVLGGEYVSWKCEEAFDEERELLFVNYKPTFHVVFSVERHTVRERRQTVSQGTVPPRFAARGTVVTVSGRELEMDPAVA